MEAWQIWIDALGACLTFFMQAFGLPEALAIIALTVLARVVLLPASWASARRMHENKRATDRLKPHIAQLQQQWKDHPKELAMRTLALYRENGIRFFDLNTLLNIGAQGIVGLGIFQAVRHALFGSNFLWIANIGKPDILLSLIVGGLTFVSMLLAPGATEQGMLLVYAIPAIVSVLALVSFPSAIGIYWATSNVISVAQALVVRRVLATHTPMEHRA